jgi:hypothetical protein
MAISPGRVHSLGGAARIEEAGLCYENKRLFRKNPTPDIQFGSSDFVQSATQVERACVGALGISPRNWAIQGPIHLEDPGPVAVLLKALLITGRKY